jgi:hypothetical protein
MLDNGFLEIVLPGMLVLLALVIFVGAFIRTDLQAQHGLGTARSELFGEKSPRRYHSIWRSSYIYRYRNHPRHIDYHYLHRKAAGDGLKKIRGPAVISGALIFLAWVCGEVALAMA